MNLSLQVLVQRAMESDDEEEIRECIETAKETYSRAGVPRGHRYWLEFLTTTRDSLHLRKIVREIIKVEGMRVTFWGYLEHPEFSYETAGVILRELDESCIDEIRDMEKMYRGRFPTIINDDGWNLNLPHERLTALLNPDV